MNENINKTMKNLYISLAKFQQEVPVIFKETKGYGYKYADLPTILETINPLLKKHGLGFTQLVNKDCLKTVLFHIESGELLESETQINYGVSLKGMNDFQVLGSQITYLRRYALSSMLGLVTDVDNDANGEQKKQELLPNTKQWEQAIIYLQKGGSINEIRGKYDISTENQTKLQKSI